MKKIPLEIDLAELFESKQTALKIAAVELAGREKLFCAVPNLIEILLEKEGTDLCKKAIKALGEIGEVKCVPALLKKLNQNVVDNCEREILIALKKFGVPAIPYLMELIHEKDVPSFKVITQILGSLKVKTTLVTLAEILLSKSSGLWTKMHVAQALEKIGDPLVLDQLRKSLLSLRNDQKTFASNVALENFKILSQVLISAICKMSSSPRDYRMIKAYLKRTGLNENYNYFPSGTKLHIGDSIRKLRLRLLGGIE